MKKVRRALRAMRRGARARLTLVKLRDDVRAMVRAAAAEQRGVS
jgi:hypothetical protein